MVKAGGRLRVRPVAHQPHPEDVVVLIEVDAVLGDQKRKPCVALLPRRTGGVVKFPKQRQVGKLTGGFVNLSAWFRDMGVPDANT